MDLDLKSIAEEGNYNWIKVKKYQRLKSDIQNVRYVHDMEYDWLAEYEHLAKHHNTETEFLIKVCRELAKNLIVSNDPYPDTQ